METVDVRIYLFTNGPSPLTRLSGNPVHGSRSDLYFVYVFPRIEIPDRRVETGLNFGGGLERHSTGEN